MGGKVNGTYDTLGVFHVDAAQIPPEYWTSLSRAIAREVDQTFPTFAELKECYYLQLVGLAFACLSSAVVFSIAHAILR